MKWISERWGEFGAYLRRNRPYLILFGLVLAFITIFEAPHMYVVVHPGEIAVEYKLFLQGTITDRLFGEGIHFIWPWNRMYVYNTRIQEAGQNLSVLTKDGLEVTISLSIRYHPELTMIGVLHQQIGPDYANTIAIPEVDSAVRTSVGEMTIEELYGGVRETSQVVSATSGAAGTPNSAAVATGLTAATAAGVTTAQTLAVSEDTTLIGAINKAVDQAAKKYVLIDNVIITRIKVPDYVQAAIQKKIEQQQVAETTNYKVQESMLQIQVANNEAQRNLTLSKSLTPEILRLRGIEATEKLANSANSKVIVVGNGPNALPVILGAQ
jgi:regulator of protease activity HflC (stomatin/prohibitin superfamily)